MGTRTLSLALVLRALFLDGDAYDRLRDDDNPFVEGLFLVMIIGAGGALLSLIGKLVVWATTPSMDAIKNAILQSFQGMSWWSNVAGNPAALASFNRWWELGWRILPVLSGSPSPAGAAFDILAWPLLGLIGWLLYGTLAYLFARLFRGTGTLNQTLGTVALASSPLLLRGLGFIPFLTIGSAVNTWQLICRYKALRSAHRLSWGRAFWATLLPFAVYLVFWIVLGISALAVMGLLGGR